MEFFLLRLRKDSSPIETWEDVEVLGKKGKYYQVHAKHGTIVSHARELEDIHSDLVSYRVRVKDEVDVTALQGVVVLKDLHYLNEKHYVLRMTPETLELHKTLFVHFGEERNMTNG